MGDRAVHALEQAWLVPPRLLLLLLPLEWLFALVTALRRRAYERGWLKKEHPGVPVIVVGNLSVGGTGKTPVVIALVRALEAEGMGPAVISRGYGGTYSGVQRVRADSDARVMGDEAVLIASSVASPVYVGRDRVSAARAAVAAGASLIVSDDGLQHYALARDVEIVTMDSSLRFGNGHLLPVGPLREAPRRMAGVDFVLERGGKEPLTALRFVPRHFRRLGSDEIRPLQTRDFDGGVHALAAIARPERFFTTLAELGITARPHALGDHEALSEALLRSLGDRPLIMTSKDAVKYPAALHPDAWVLEMEVLFPEGFVESLLGHLKRLNADIARETGP